MKFQDLLAYKKSFSLAMEILEISKGFPKEEVFALTSQIRRSSRAVSSAIAESYGKRKYPKHYQSKLTDSDSENLETQTWIEFAEACEYITEEQKIELINKSEEVGRLLNYMINNPDKFGVVKD
ncbi:four helix bundle protein [Jejudonia soesokkakensis]|uniref:Four helix bundle protein n=1 Tax=Jejudonia soesokkakensis TaxID=1323432 RepID=A0ABW2MV07_9FLAO